MQSLADQMNATLDGWLTDAPDSVCCVLDSGGDDMVALLGISEQREGDSLVMRLKVPAAQLPSDMLPALVCMPADNWRLRQRTVEIALDDFENRRAPRVCGWVVGTNSARALVTVFAASLLRVAPNGSRFLFRHHDPRVRACLTALIGDRWMSSVIGGVRAWLFVGLDERPMQTCSGSIDEVSVHDSTRVHQAITRCEEINHAIELSREQGWVFQANAYNVADAALSRAEAFAFDGAADRLAYMLHALTLSPNFDTHPEINAALRAAHAKHETYTEAMTRIPAQTWQAARAFAL